MIELSELFKLCDGFENQVRQKSIKKLMEDGYEESIATEYYNIWRKYYEKLRIVNS